MSCPTQPFLSYPFLPYSTPSSTQPHPTLPYPLLSYPTPSPYPVLHCSALFCPIVSCFVLSRIVRPHPTLLCSALLCLVLLLYHSLHVTSLLCARSKNKYMVCVVEDRTISWQVAVRVGVGVGALLFVQLDLTRHSTSCKGWVQGHCTMRKHIQCFNSSWLCYVELVTVVS
jgi:hypothetical protein